MFINLALVSQVPLDQPGALSPIIVPTQEQPLLAVSLGLLKLPPKRLDPDAIPSPVSRYLCGPGEGACGYQISEST